MDQTTILIVDDHAVLRMGLASLLNSQKDLKVVADAENADEALSKSARLHPSVVVMDLLIPGRNGIEITRDLVAADPDIKVLVLTSYSTSSGIAAALEAGAKGAILKSAPFEDITYAIREVAAGREFVSAEIQRVLEEDPPLKSLTPRQLSVLRLMAQGLSNPDISKALGIREDVVKDHVIAILQRLDAANRTEAVSIAFRHHLI